MCDHSNEGYWAVLSCGTVYYAVQGGSNFKSVDETLVCDYSNERCWAVFSCGTFCVHNDLNSYIFVNEILLCEQSNS